MELVKMIYLYIALGAAAIIAAAVLMISYVCFRMAFFVNRRRKKPLGTIPEGEIYEPFREQMEQWAREVRALPCEQVSITSFDGLELHGKYYEYAPGAPVELMFHGYRGSAERDLCGGVQRCFSLGRSALLVDQRCSGRSGGNVITFGVKEHRDCLAWVDFMCEHFGPDVRIILCGISMGASTVLMAAGRPLPENVVGVLADCGFTSAEDIIKKVIKQMGLPAGISYPFVRLGARIYGGFDLEEYSAAEAMKQCSVPAIFFHGEDDDFVPCEMSRRNFDACVSRKMLVTIPGAGHGLSYPVAPEKYLESLKGFFEKETACAGK